MKKFNHIGIGLALGIIVPMLFIWLYLERFYPVEVPFFETIKMLWGSVTFAKLLLLSIFPNLILVFAFYKFDAFKIAAGTLCGGILYLIPCFFI